MRRLFTSAEAGLTPAALRWGERTGRWRRADRGVWAEGPDDVLPLDRARAAVVATGGVASHHLAGVLYGLDGVGLEGTWVTVGRNASSSRARTSRRDLPPGRLVTVAGLRCTDGRQTLLDLATCLDDVVWEQARESTLRKRLTSVAALETARAGRVRRVLLLRPPGATPTESLLETLTVQLARTVPGLPDPVRQLRLDGVARLDLAWPVLGLFVELDGQHHKDQPVYDSRRETAVVAATGWLCGRFTWTEIVHMPRSSARRLGQLADQARRRPAVQPLSSSATR